MNHGFDEMLRCSIESGATLDQGIAELRTAHASVIDCIKAVRVVLLCDLGEAKRIVHCSSAWEDSREKHDRFHDEIERTLNH
jgi:hypothetical protein